MRGAARSNVLLRGGGGRVLLRPSPAAAAIVRPGSKSNLHLVSSSLGAAHARRPFHASARALWAAASSAGEDGEEDDAAAAAANELAAAENRAKAALEEKERSAAYDRWVEAVRGQLRLIEARVLNRKPDGTSDDDYDDDDSIDKLKEMFDNSPRFALSSADSESAPATRKKTPLITFEDEPRKPTYMPYIMLDPKWYQNTTEDERLQQVLAWRPFTPRAVAAEKADQQFREDPFRNKSQAYSGRVVAENFRRSRLDKYMQEELANKRKVYSNIETNDDTKASMDEIKQSFRANLAMIENIGGEELGEEMVEPEVTRADKYTKPPGFVSATDMLKFSEEKLQEDLQKLMKKAKKCAFCRPAAQRPVLDPMNVALLTMFMTPMGDIIGRRHNGNCRRHQRKLATTIKRAKHMGIFSYKYSSFTIYSPFHAPPEVYAEDDGEDDEYETGDEGDVGEMDEYEDEDEDDESDDEQGPAAGGGGRF